MFLCGGYSLDVDKILNDCKFKEMEDYIFRTHNPVRFTGVMNGYKDGYKTYLLI